MAVMTSEEREKTARIFARNVYNGARCSVSHTDIVAAVGSFDDSFEGLPTALPNQAQSIAVNLNSSLPDPFKSEASVAQKATLLAVMFGVKYGYINSGGD